VELPLCVVQPTLGQLYSVIARCFCTLKAFLVCTKTEQNFRKFNSRIQESHSSCTCTIYQQTSALIRGPIKLTSSHLSSTMDAFGLLSIIFLAIIGLGMGAITTREDFNKSMAKKSAPFIGFCRSVSVPLCLFLSMSVCFCLCLCLSVSQSVSRPVCDSIYVDPDSSLCPTVNTSSCPCSPSLSAKPSASRRPTP
jgi:hypothetical protein